MRTSTLAITTLTLGAVVSAQAAWGQSAYSSFGPSHLVNATDPWTMWPVGGPGYPEIAVHFTARASGRVTGVSMGLWAAAPDEAAISFYSDANGRPGAVLSVSSVAVPVVPSPSIQAPELFPIGGAVELRAGQSYFLSVTSSQLNWLPWGFADGPNAAPELMCCRIEVNNPAGWRDSRVVAPPAFEVLVPAPGSVGLLVGGLIIAASRRRRDDPPPRTHDRAVGPCEATM